MPHNHTHWLIITLVSALALALCASVNGHFRKRRTDARALAIAAIRDQLQQLDDVVSALAPLPMPRGIRQLLSDHHQGLSAALARFGERPQGPVLAPAQGATVTALASAQALTQVLSDLARTQAYLFELERFGRVSRIDRHTLSEDMAQVEVLIQVESLSTWAELPDTPPQQALSYLREAQALLAGARHLDSSFAARAALLRAREIGIGVAARRCTVEPPGDEDAVHCADDLRATQAR